jgi:hypothetical protein
VQFETIMGVENFLFWGERKKKITGRLAMELSGALG